MTVIQNKMKYFWVVAAGFMLFCYLLSGVAFAQRVSGITIDENLKPGMPLKDAIELLGAPEKVKISDMGTVIMPYDNIGLSIEILSDRTTIEAIHLQSGFKGRFASGLSIGDDIQKIIASYNQPDTQTKEVIEYSLPARRFLISQDKVTGADLYKDKSALYHQIPVKVVKRFEEKVADRNMEKMAERSEEKVTVSNEEKVAENYQEKDDDDYYNEEGEEQKEPEIDVFALYGFKVKQKNNGVVITEVTPGSFAEEGGLKVGEPIRKVFYEKSSMRNIYAIAGLKSILKRAIEKRRKFVNILQSENTFTKMKVPRIYSRR